MRPRCAEGDAELAPRSGDVLFRWSPWPARARAWIVAAVVGRAWAWRSRGTRSIGGVGVEGSRSSRLAGRRGPITGCRRARHALRRRSTSNPVDPEDRPAGRDTTDPGQCGEASPARRLRSRRVDQADQRRSTRSLGDLGVPAHGGGLLDPGRRLEHMPGHRLGRCPGVTDLLLASSPFTSACCPTKPPAWGSIIEVGPFLSRMEIVGKDPIRITSAYDLRIPTPTSPTTST